MADEAGPVVPNLAKTNAPAVPTAPLPQVVEAVPVVPAEPPAEKTWTPDRILSFILMSLFAVFAVGLVIALGRWEVLAPVPFLPWLVGAAIVAGPAWKAYIDMAEEAKGRRMRQEQAKTAYGVQVSRTPRDRNQG